MKKKGAFSLIELAVALVLIGMILTFLFRFFTHLVIHHEKIQEAKEEVLEHIHIQTRLNNIFSQIPSSFDLDHSSFFTETTNNSTILSFIFDNGIDPDPSFSGFVEAKLFEKDKKLILLLSSLAEEGEEKKIRQEILAQDLKKCSFAFYQTQKEAKWISKWSKEETTPPPMIKMEITKGDNPKEILSFAFSLPAFQQDLIFEKKP